MPVIKPAKFALLLTLSTISIAQTSTEPNSPKKSSTPPTSASASTTPALSTADKLAITDCERRKQEARKEFDAATQDELQIEREFEQSHPGWKVNPATFAVESVPKPEPKK